MSAGKVAWDVLRGRGLTAAGFNGPGEHFGTVLTKLGIGRVVLFPGTVAFYSYFRSFRLSGIFNARNGPSAKRVDELQK